MAEVIETEYTSRRIWSRNSIFDALSIAQKVMREIENLMFEAYDEDVARLSDELKATSERCALLEDRLRERGDDPSELDAAYNVIKLLVDKLGGSVRLKSDQMMDYGSKYLVVSDSPDTGYKRLDVKERLSDSSV